MLTGCRIRRGILLAGRQSRGCCRRVSEPNRRHAACDRYCQGIRRRRRPCVAKTAARRRFADGCPQRRPLACFVGVLDAWAEGHGCASSSGKIRAISAITAGVQLGPVANDYSQTPVYTLIETPRSPDIKSRLFLTDDPSLVVLYEQLRRQTVSTLRGASKVNPKTEWEFVLHSAKLYDRMGCDLLGLDLGKSCFFNFPDECNN